MKKIISTILIFGLSITLLSGCGEQKAGEPQNESSTQSDASSVSPVDFSKNDSDMFTERDCKSDFNENDAVIVKLNGKSTSASSKSVKISGSTVTITENKTHIISGKLDNGMIIVDAVESAKLQLVFSGVDIKSQASAALYIKEADKVFITLADGTENTLSNGGEFTAIDENNIDAALFSKQDLTINGSGKLTVTSPAGHGIVCKDDLVITDGSYVINSASHGLDANDSIRISKATLTIDAGKDAIHAENSDDTSLGFIYISSGNIKAEAEGDGISAGAYMQIVSGSFELLAGGGSQNGTKEHSDSFGGFMGGGRPGQMRPDSVQNTENDESSTSMKGLKAAGELMISGGEITVNSADDSIHSDASITINGGTLSIASGDDAIHAEDTLTVASGKINISESYEGLEALHIDVQGGDIKLIASDDGLNAAGGTDQSGFAGGRDGMFGGRDGMFGGRDGMFGGRGGMGDPGGMGGGMSSGSNGSIKISGGTLYINSSGDGLDANGTLEISGGHTTVVGPTQGDTATLDYDKSGIITGGTFIGTGASGMAQSFSDSKQGVIAVNAGNQAADTEIVLKDATGKTVISYRPELNFSVVILSSPDIIKGETYLITIGSESGEMQAN